MSTDDTNIDTKLDSLIPQNRAQICFSEDPTDEDLALNWTLSQIDKLEIRKCRGEDNQRIFALQLCVLRKYGYFLNTYEKISLKVVNYINHQLCLSPVLFLECNVREATEIEYEQRICQYLECQRYNDAVETRLKSWIFDKISEGDLPQDLIYPIQDILRSWKVVLPGQTTIERLLTSIYNKFEKEIFESISENIPPYVCEEIDRILEIPETDSKSRLNLFKDYPKEAQPENLLNYIEKYWQLKFMGIGVINFSGISTKRVHNLFQLTKHYNAYRLRRFYNSKRYAMVGCFLVESLKSILDYIVDMHDQYLIKINRHAKISFEKKHKEIRKSHKQGINTLIRLSKIILELENSPDKSMKELFHQVKPEEIRYAMDSCEKFKRLEEVGFVGELQARYSWLKRYLPDLFQLPFQGEVGSAYIVEGLNIVNKLNLGALKCLPENTPCQFVPSSWQKALYNQDGSINQQVWEISLAFALRDALRSRDIFLPESKHYVSFWNLIDEPKTQDESRNKIYHSLGVPSQFDQVLMRLQNEFDEIAYQTAIGLPTNPYASIENGSLKVKRQDALEVPEETKRLNHILATNLPKIRIEDLLLEVDGWTGFTKEFHPLEGYDARASDISSILLAAIVAHGTNLGLLTMAASTYDITIDMLQNTKWFIRQPTIKAANNLLVNFHSKLPLSLIWGNATTSSSDGQRFGIKPSSLLGNIYPRYFGYYDRAITIYTHISDQYSVFSTQVISCLEREALYVLDGLLTNDTVLQIHQHYTDTHGFIEIIFSLCYLLGISFMPRIKDLKRQQLYKIDKSKNYGALEPLFVGKVDIELIREQWDSMIRVATSLLNHTTPAHVIVKHLVNSTRSDRLSKAFTALGRVLKTAFILRYIHDEQIRRIVLLQLNRGELRHYMANHFFFADQGEFRTKDFEEIMNKASCLSLLSNAALIWNTVKIGEIVDSLKSRGEVIEDKFLARVSPLMFAHIIPNGTYNFTKNK